MRNLVREINENLRGQGNRIELQRKIDDLRDKLRAKEEQLTDIEIAIDELKEHGTTTVEPFSGHSLDDLYEIWNMADREINRIADQISRLKYQL